jgi:hypothetical protein
MRACHAGEEIQGEERGLRQFGVFASPAVPIQPLAGGCPMRKIRMELEQLHVDTFETSSVPDARGTVRGHWSQVGTCDGRVATCQVGGTCGPGCGTLKCTGLDCV